MEDARWRVEGGEYRRKVLLEWWQKQTHRGERGECRRYKQERTRSEMDKEGNAAERMVVVYEVQLLEERWEGPRVSELTLREEDRRLERWDWGEAINSISRCSKRGVDRSVVGEGIRIYRIQKMLYYPGQGEIGRVGGRSGPQCVGEGWWDGCRVVCKEDNSVYSDV